jgi:hypothetical protein
LPAGIFSLWKYKPYGTHVRNTFNNAVIKMFLDEKYSGHAYIFDVNLIHLWI